MKHPIVPIRGIFLAAILLLAVKAFSQVAPVSENSDTPVPEHTKIERPNSLAFLFVVDNFFDGARPFRQSLRLPTMGGEYGRKLSREWSINSSFRLCYRNYAYILKLPLHIGDITQRSITFVDISLYRNIFTWSSGTLGGFGGCSLRAGGEFMYVGKSSFEPLIDKYYLFDPGVLGGFRGYQSLPSHFGISLEAKYGYYIWTNPRPYLYAYDLLNRPTRNLFAAQAAIHFNF